MDKKLKIVALSVLAVNAAILVTNEILFRREMKKLDNDAYAKATTNN